MPEEKQAEACFERLEKLSREELDQEAQKCVLWEQKCVASLIAHLSEISKRKAHLELGYKDLFDYGVRRLKLSEGSVYLRLQVAGVARRFPALLSLLAQNRMSLTVAGMLAPHLVNLTTSFGLKWSLERSSSERRWPKAGRLLTIGERPGRRQTLFVAEPSSDRSSRA